MTGIVLPASVPDSGGSQSQTVRFLGARAFAGCTKLESVTLPSGVTETGDNVFEGCTSLRDVYYAGTSTQWSSVYRTGLPYSYTIPGGTETVTVTVHYESTGPSAP